MWHSDTISLALSRCWLHTHAPARPRVHTDVHARTHKPCFPSASADVPQRAYVSQTQHMCACLHLIYPKMFFSCAMAGATWGHMTCLSLTNIVCRSSKHTHTYIHKIRNIFIDCLTNSMLFAGASITTISKPSPRGPSWETLNSKPCELNA